MSVELLSELIHGSSQENWKDRNEQALRALYDDGRYPLRVREQVTLRAHDIKVGGDSGVPFAAYIHPQNPSSGPYGGASFAIFPIPNGPALVSLVVGTQGLSPDEAILGRPGHARKARAICDWLNRTHGDGTLVAWAKQDPTRTDLGVPDNLRQNWSEYKDVFDRYGRVLYCLFRPTANRETTTLALTAVLDLFFEERGYKPRAAFEKNFEGIRSEWFDCIMPGLDSSDVQELLNERRYVILQGPPGTGKTRLAANLLRDVYQGRGRSIQFHPNSTYESFIGGLAPTQTAGELGLRFEPLAGMLMQAAAASAAEPDKPHLLHIDEINRADLGKILGEAIFLLEADAGQRTIQLPYDFGPPFHRQFHLPPNLHILGTMNSADRSIAILDVAVRRRFAFVSLWPSMRVVENNSCPIMHKAFRDLISIFVENASDDAFALVPGHSYFLEFTEDRAKRRLRTNLAPLLDEYLAQGYVTGFAEPIRAYLQWLRSL